MEVKVLVEPAEEPVTLDEAKSYLKVSFTEDDQLITTLIKAVRDYAEKYTQLSFVTKTLQLHTSVCWDSDAEIPYGPHQSITSVTRISSDGTEEVLSTDQYYVLGNDFLSLSTGRRFKVSEGWYNNRIIVEYVAGYGNASQVPDAIKVAILKEVAELYENRENTVVGTIIADLTLTSRKLLNPYRRNVLL